MNRFAVVMTVASLACLPACSTDESTPNTTDPDRTPPPASTTQTPAADPGDTDTADTAGPDTDGMTTTASGLQYKVLEEGQQDAPSPTARDTVTVHYRGVLTNGEEFDSSYKRGEPATFPLNRVIAGWTEGLQLMSEGDTYRFVIPPTLGYGSRRAGSIPPNSTLIFDVELIEIE